MLAVELAATPITLQRAIQGDATFSAESTFGIAKWFAGIRRLHFPVGGRKAQALGNAFNKSQRGLRAFSSLTSLQRQKEW
jgi:hypothetical protein